MHYYRQAKSEIRIQRDEKNKAEKAKQRFEARKERLEREKLEREEKHRKAKEARLAANKAKEESAVADNANSAVDAGATEAKDKVARRLRVRKQRKHSRPTQRMKVIQQIPTNQALRQTIKKQVQARAGEKSRTSPEEAQLESADKQVEQASSPEDDKKAKAAAAIARAKAKKRHKLKTKRKMKALSNHQPQNSQVTSHHHQKMRKKPKLLPLSPEQKQRPRKPASLKHLQQKNLRALKAKSILNFPILKLIQS